jgi:hypothetical protein
MSAGIFSDHAPYPAGWIIIGGAVLLLILIAIADRLSDGGDRHGV